MDIGKIGAFCFLDAMSAEESAAFCRRVEHVGYQVLWSPAAWVCPSVIVILERDASTARARARQHLSFYAYQENYQRILLAQGFTREDFANGCSDRLIDTMVAWGSEEHVRDRIDAHLASAFPSSPKRSRSRNGESL